MSRSRAAGGVRSGRDLALGVAEELSECWGFRWEAQEGYRQCLAHSDGRAEEPKGSSVVCFPRKSQGSTVEAHLMVLPTPLRFRFLFIASLWTWFLGSHRLYSFVIIMPVCWHTPFPCGSTSVLTTSFLWLVLCQALRSVEKASPFPHTYWSWLIG